MKGFEIRTFAEHDPTGAARDREELLALFGEGKVRPLVDGVYPLRETGTAMRSLTERRATGKVVILPWESRLRWE